jgi:hypothetical protein
MVGGKVAGGETPASPLALEAAYRAACGIDHIKQNQLAAILARKSTRIISKIIFIIISSNLA